MRLELRNDSLVACPQCGVTEPILVAGLGEPFAADMSAVFEGAWARREDELTRLFAAERAELETAHREALVSMEALMRQEARAARDGVERAYSGYVAAVEELAAPRARRWRLLKRRWERRLAADLAVATDALKEQTRRA